MYIYVVPMMQLGLFRFAWPLASCISDTILMTQSEVDLDLLGLMYQVIIYAILMTESLLILIHLASCAIPMMQWD